MTDPRRGSRLESLALEAAERRVRSDLAASAGEPGRIPPWTVIAAALALFVGGFALRLAVDDPGVVTDIDTPEAYRNIFGREATP